MKNFKESNQIEPKRHSSESALIGLVMCDACTKRGKTWNGSEPNCAFKGGRFGENWNCATANLIRDICFEGQELPHEIDYQYCEDQKYATIKVDHIELDDSPLALWVSWYKSRGSTDAMWLLYEKAQPRKPTEAQCLKIISAYT